MLIILERIWMIDIEASLDTEKNNDICILTFSEPEWKLDELSDDIFRSEIEDKARVKWIKNVSVNPSRWCYVFLSIAQKMCGLVITKLMF